VTGGILLQRGAVQPQPLAVEVDARAVPGQLAQADVRGVGALLADRARGEPSLRTPKTLYLG
jgi:hypothetical protein